MVFGVASVFSDDIAIDLGTANTLVCVVGRGIIIDEPSVVALKNQRGTRELLAVGLKAKQMLGRTPDGIETIRPLREGVIADFLATEEMLRQFIKRAKTKSGFRRPRILISVPAGATPVERRAVYETALSAGARQVFLIEEPVAAAVGAGLPIDEPTGSMVLDIGGGTADLAVLSLGGIVMARSIKVAGNALDEAIIRYVRREHQLLIGEANAERIKIEAGTASEIPNGRAAEIHIMGRDVKLGRPKTIVLAPQHIAAALSEPLERLAEFVQRALEELPPELAHDICERGVRITGGGALLDKIDVELERRVGVKFIIPDTPLQCVVRGSARILQNLAGREHLLIKP
jgi:rod shape-determining protein MreB